MAGSFEHHASDFFAPPPESFPAAPRAVRLRRSPIFLMTISFLLTLFSIAALVTSMSTLLLQSLARHAGIAVPGRVTQKFVQGPTGQVRVVQFTFQIGEETFHSHQTTDADDYNRAQVGAAVRARVWPTWPAYAAYVEDFGTSRYDIWFAIFGVLWSALMLAILWYIRRDAARRRRLAEYGTAALATITAKETRGNRKAFRVSYHYRIPDGSGGMIACNATMAVASHDYSALDIGHVVTVLFDPQKPKNRSLIYRCGEYEIIGVG